VSADKDRLGDKLRKKEKADEDLYFARQDERTLEQLKAAKDADVELGRCPRCGVELIEVERENVKVDLCKQCSGIWLDAGELEALEREQADHESWFSHWLRTVLER
jgi:hypothetical protein